MQRITRSLRSFVRVPVWGGNCEWLRAMARAPEKRIATQMIDANPLPLPTAKFESLLIVRLSAMGDIIHTLPAAAALRQAFPQATLGWLIEERWAELLCTLRYPRSGPRSAQRPLVDRVHTVNLAEWRRALFSFNTMQQMAAGLSQLRGIQYDAVIDFQGAVRSALLARWSGAPVVFGDVQPRENAASMFYSRKEFANKRSTHVIEQALELAEAVVPNASQQSTSAASLSGAAESTSRFNGRGSILQPHAEFPVDPDAEKKIASLTAGAGEFIILNPGAGWGAKMWPAERYGHVAKELAKDGVASLVNYGPGGEGLAGE